VLPIGEPIGVIGTADEPIDLAALGVGKSEVRTPKSEVEKREPQGNGAAPARGPLAPALAAGQVPDPGPRTPDSGLPTPDHVIASPVARRIADERGVDLRQVRGTGPGGRITRKDVENFVPAPAAAATPDSGLRTPDSGLRTPDSSSEQPLTRLRQIIARRMVEAKQQVPHFYVTIDVDMAAAMAVREQANGWLDDAHKLSVNDLIVKAAATALREFPALNASFAGDKVVVHTQVNVGVAVSVPGGLTTVVVHDADRKTLAQIAAETKALVARAREGKVRPEDIEGSTFTVSNLGMFDVDSFVAIINPPEAAILALGSVQQVPVVKDGQFAVGTRMKATLSADHRATDGAEAARFLQVLRRTLESPLRMMV
jgi:pyruvate dehydrogenase E2 component (dihydrolipoamide acetyltransferase)